MAHQHTKQRKKQRKILLPSEEYNKADGSDCVEILHLIQKLNSLNSPCSNSFSNKYIRHQIPQLSQSETSSFEISGSYTGDVSDVSFRSCSSSVHPKHPLAPISTNPNDLKNNKQTSNNNNNNIEKVELIEISDDPFNTMYTKAIDNTPCDDVLDIFQEISCDINEDEINYNYKQYQQRKKKKRT
eukprot:283699_1